ncbi:hypothetical protein C7212DRAFT_276728 [Tuber magnatum]|uniref:Uncharacterized protein n=1 Tax=Tuber magnatum TaxID=42249 RepID=A0A317STT9_9PEZI|nr:hypothetical protein C7212DRAFT_276728 [Tuber magnatum]
MDYYLNEGLEGVERQHYRGARSFARAIQAQADELRSGNLSAGQYAVFSPVTQAELAKLKCSRDDSHKSLRFLYLNGAETLIVKIMPGPTHETATRELADKVKEKIGVMGLRRAVRDMGGTTYLGAESQKEADSAIRPTAFRPLETNWPTVVFECGVSESLPRLITDSNWWLANSAHDVKIVLLISVNKPQRKIHLEQWEDLTVPNPHITRNNPNPPRTWPTKVNEINIDGGTITGTPLRLPFAKIFLRPAGPGEGDIVLSAQDLLDYSEDVWSGVP